MHHILQIAVSFVAFTIFLNRTAPTGPETADGASMAIIRCRYTFTGSLWLPSTVPKITRNSVIRRTLVPRSQCVFMFNQERAVGTAVRFARRLHRIIPSSATRCAGLAVNLIAWQRHSKPLAAVAAIGVDAGQIIKIASSLL